MQRLSSIREALLNELSGNDARLRFINTRLILTVGVSLYAQTFVEDSDEARVKMTLEQLHKMGFLQMEGSGGK